MFIPKNKKGRNKTGMRAYAEAFIEKQNGIYMHQNAPRRLAMGYSLGARMEIPYWKSLS
jgi:hypothetical protein